MKNSYVDGIITKVLDRKWSLLKDELNKTHDFLRFAQKKISDQF